MVFPTSRFYSVLDVLDSLYTIYSIQNPPPSFLGALVFWNLIMRLLYRQISRLHKILWGVVLSLLCCLIRSWGSTRERGTALGSEGTMRGGNAGISILRGDSHSIKNSMIFIGLMHNNLQTIKDLQSLIIFRYLNDTNMSTISSIVFS